MSTFNNGKAYHGSEAIKKGKLTGRTDTDYFYFFCPKCPDRRILRILEHEIMVQEKDNRYNKEFKKKAKGGFTIAFHLICENCKHEDFVKISNLGWQDGSWDTIEQKYNFKSET